MEKKNTHLKFAMISVAASIVLSLIIHLLHAELVMGMQYIVYLPYFALVIFNGISYSKLNNANVTFGNVFMSGFKLSAIVCGIMAAWAIALLFIFPEIKEKTMEVSRQTMQQKNTATDDQIEMGMKIVEKGFAFIFIIGTAVGYLFWGTICSLISAAVAKKNLEIPVSGDNF